MKILSCAVQNSFINIQTMKCNFCTIAHCFRPLPGEHGRQNILRSTEDFGEQCATTIKAGCVELAELSIEYYTKLCHFRGIFIPIFKNKSGEELTTVESKVITELVEFAVPVREHNYCHSEHGLKHKGLVRLTAWVKHCIPTVVLEEEALTNCTITFDGFRVFLLAFCATVFLHVEHSPHVEQKSFHSQLKSIFTAYVPI